jgi:hypothetical protein
MQDGVLAQHQIHHGGTHLEIICASKMKIFGWLDVQYRMWTLIGDTRNMLQDQPELV